jgi:2-deoxy-D-gluconate 3-dehydrogenase
MGILDRFRLDGKLALVTGSATGLGAAIAVALAEAGASVACHGNRRPAEKTSEAIRALGHKSGSFAADLSQPDGADRLYEAVLAEMGSPDVLVNNAGTIYREPAEEHDLQAWMTVVQVNLNSVFRLSQLAGRSMLERRQGKIINIASLLSFQGGIRVPAYAASKGGVAAAQCAGERHCSGLLSHRKYHRTAGGRGPQQPNTGAHPVGTMGGAGRYRRCGGVSRIACKRLHYG